LMTDAASVQNEDRALGAIDLMTERPACSNLLSSNS